MFVLPEVLQKNRSSGVCMCVCVCARAQRFFLQGICLCDYGGWKVPSSIGSKMETQGNWCVDLVWVWRPENQISSSKAGGSSHDKSWCFSSNAKARKGQPPCSRHWGQWLSLLIHIFASLRPSTDWMRPTHLRSIFFTQCKKSQILVSSRNSLIDMPRIALDQMSGHPGAQSICYKVNHHTVRLIPWLYSCGTLPHIAKETLPLLVRLFIRWL
jgi:hypothetical protein